MEKSGIISTIQGLNNPCSIIKAYVINITPVLAEKMLQNNDHNRKIRDTGVKKYMRDIATGNWKQNGVSIVFDENGTLLDGQHRLTACVKTNTVLKNVVVAVVPVSEGNGYDLGIARSVRDVAFFENKAEKVYYDSLISSAVGIILGDRGVSKMEIINTIEKYFEECETVRKIFTNCGGRTVSKIKKSGTVAAILKACICKAPQYEVERFCDILISGISLYPKDVCVIKLRDYLLNLEKSGGSPQRETMRLTEKVLDNFLKDKELKRLPKVDKETFVCSLRE